MLASIDAIGLFSSLAGYSAHRVVIPCYNAWL